MAGAGYKLFNSGDVLTAAQVNTYLQEQAVMRFANATARTTALSGVLAEGMVSYLDDINKVQVYNGSSWVDVSGDGDITGVTAGTGISGGGTTGTVTITNDMATTITASGDIIVGTGSGTYDNLPIGTTGQVLTADTTVSPYKVKWAAAAAGADFVAGKNKIINGDFYWNQRNFSSSTSSGDYLFDRWRLTRAGGTGTYSAQTFTLGDAPVAGYEGRNFLQIVTSSQSAAGDYARIDQRIESVRTFANQTVTVSFWAKANSGTPGIAANFYQVFGTGGSPSADVAGTGSKVTLSTSWARYSMTFTIASISGKTIGTNNNDFLQLSLWVTAGSNFNTETNTLGNQNNTFQIWGVQVEAGSVATPFTTATGTLAGELAACQRYYFRIGGEKVYEQMGMGMAGSTTAAGIAVQLPVSMRVAPTSIDYATLALQPYINGTITAITSATIDSVISKNVGSITANVASGLTTGQTYRMFSNNSTAGYIAFSAEL